MYGAYLPRSPASVLVLGSGALQIGQAGEFDYSGSQAIKALKEEGIATVLINPNIATIQTSEGLADKRLPHRGHPGVRRADPRQGGGGRASCSPSAGRPRSTAASRSTRRASWSKYGVRVLGTPVKAIRDTEDRKLFIERLAEIGVKTARSRACSTADEARAAAREIGFPVMLRGGFALGRPGQRHRRDRGRARRTPCAAPSPAACTQVLVEECLRGWKEIEYEVVRDGRDNCITVCNMENLDPMGIHTGESIVVAPSQTLNDEEYQLLRSVAIKTIRHLGIVGECNIQYALDPPGHRLPRHRGQRPPLALERPGQQGHRLPAGLRRREARAWATRCPEIPNAITRRTTAFFEPALDYLVCKVPRWDLAKFRGASMRIGSEMKSVGEVMAIGRTFPEVIQKALRMLDIGVRGLDPDAFEFEDLRGRARQRHAAAHLRRRPGAAARDDGGAHPRAHAHRPLVPPRHRAHRPGAPRAEARSRRPSTRPLCARPRSWASADRDDRPAHAGPAGQHPRRAQAAGHRPAPGADRHPGRGVPGGDELPLLQLPRPGDRRRRPRGARRSWCSARGPTASARAWSSTGAASTR